MIGKYWTAGRKGLEENRSFSSCSRRGRTTTHCVVPLKSKGSKVYERNFLFIWNCKKMRWWWRVRYLFNRILFLSCSPQDIFITGIFLILWSFWSYFDWPYRIMGKSRTTDFYLSRKKEKKVKEIFGRKMIIKAKEK